jgi:hypothetical protein
VEISPLWSALVAARAENEEFFLLKNYNKFKIYKNLYKNLKN